MGSRVAAHSALQQARRAMSVFAPSHARMTWARTSGERLSSRDASTEVDIGAVGGATRGSTRSRGRPCTARDPE
eukprot:6638352-Prymnesium_polylepis.1